MKADELTRMAVDWLLSEYPDAIVVTELSVADWGGARLDVAAITEDDLIGIEIKGEGDSPTRLDRQGLAYNMVCRRMYLLASPTIADRCSNKLPPNWAELRIEQEAICRHGYGEISHQHVASYGPHLSPAAICGTLWRDELYQVAQGENLGPMPRATVPRLTDLLCENLPVPTLHKHMVSALRNRDWSRLDSGRVHNWKKEAEKCNLLPL